MASSFRRFDVQAKYAAWLGILALIPMLVALAVFARNFNLELRQVIYRNNMYAAVLLGSVALSMLLAGVAVVFGYNSAGQRVNDRQKASWLGFFLGAGALTLNLVLAIAFVMLRLKHPG